METVNIAAYIQVHRDQLGILLHRLENRADIEVRVERTSGDRCRVQVTSPCFPVAWSGRRIEVVEDKAHRSGIGFRPEIGGDHA